MTSPDIFVKRDNLAARKDPNHVADAPKRMKTNENPPVNNSALIKTRDLLLPNNFLPLFDSLNSSRDTPEINDRYPGTSGRTQGDRNDIKPAVNAMYMGTSYIIGYLYSTLGVPRVRSNSTETSPLFGTTTELFWVLSFSCQVLIKYSPAGRFSTPETPCSFK